MTEMAQVVQDDELVALADQFDPARAMDTLTALCVEELSGRGLGSAGHDRAGQWLVDHLTGLGLVPEPHSFQVPEVFRLAAAPALAVSGPRLSGELEHRRDYAEHPRSAAMEAPVTGTAVCWDGTPVADAWTVLDVVPQGTAFAELADQLGEAGGLGLLTPQDPDGSGFLTKRTVGAPAVRLPVVAVRSDLLKQLSGSTVSAYVPVRRAAATGTNFVAALPGSAGAGRPILVTAHYDGVGADPGRHFQCAGDNASGVAVVSEVARVLIESGTPHARPIQIAVLDAEEHGALGSKHHAAELVAAGQRPDVLNVDMAGKFNGTVAVELGSDTRPIIGALDRAGKLLRIPLAAGQVASDNRQYAGAGMPAAGIGFGAAHYHSPLDSLDRIDPEAVRKAGRLLLVTIAHLAAQASTDGHDNKNFGKE
ncbi:M28 family peptidase [Kutzneria sp. NPDC051319]|uniref:M28 family metallopeptidase n=1 Tax=Kutzneria sp. NPDC051319 TaxID=3155047 RepID=UPI003419DC53